MRGYYALLGPAVISALTLLAGCYPDGDRRVIVEEIPAPTPVQDADHDSYSVSDGDCDDGDAAIYPGAAEGTANDDGNLIGDGIDNNCNGITDDGTLSFDDDQDGYSEQDGDCNDDDGERYPGRTDGCDGVDNDCDGLVDEDAKDSFEPNDTSDDATYVGDLTCDYEVLEFNINQIGDVDYFRIDILESGTGCTEGVTIFLPDDDDLSDGTLTPEHDFKMTLYKEQPDGTLATEDTTTSTVYDDVIVGSDPDSGLGVYYLQVEAQATSGDYNAVFCNDTTRLFIYGTYDYEIDL